MLEPPYASRPDNGFLLVSFSKVTRHLLHLFAPAFVAESLPNNANDYLRVIGRVHLSAVERHANRPLRKQVTAMGVLRDFGFRLCGRPGLPNVIVWEVQLPRDHLAMQ